MKTILMLCLPCITLLFPFSLFAEKTKKVSIEYTYIVPENTSIEEAKKMAIDRAQIQAIADEFGTVVLQNSTTIINNDNDQSHNKFYSIGDTEVKGEWIETTKEPIFDLIYENNVLAINVSIEGIIREVKRAELDYELKILRNGTTHEFENTEFKSGDDLYITFKSPISGYLAIYLLGEDDQAYCILPYSNQPNGIFEIKSNKTYILFSAKDATDEISPDIVEELYLTCEKQLELNQIYILFSPNQFSKCLDEDICIKSDGTIIPRHLDAKNFHKWLAKNRKKDTQMIVDRRIIQILK